MTVINALAATLAMMLTAIRMSAVFASEAEHQPTTPIQMAMETVPVTAASSAMILELDGLQMQTMHVLTM
jgi:type VI protein secretion system component VasK